MQTPSLRRRVTTAGVVVVAVVLLVVDVFMYVSMRDRLESTLDEVLATRLDIAVDLARDLPPDELVARLQALGVPAEVQPPGGPSLTSDPVSPRLLQAPPTSSRRFGITSPMLASRDATLDDGTVVRVFVTRAGVESALNGVLLVASVATIGGLVLAFLLLRRTSARALEPLGTVVDTARRTADGRTGERLQPDSPDTELGRMAVAFDEMLDALEAAVDDARDEEERSRRFLADAAHQLRTPVASLRASVESLVRERDPERRDELLGTLLRETGRSSRLVASLLRVARLDRGEEPNRTPTDLVGLCEDEVERAAGLSPGLVVRLRVVSVPSDPVHVDGEAIRESLANLLDNARRHALGHVEVVVDQQDGAVAVAVTDDGPGVADAHAKLVFERFTSLDGRGGSGLGLPIARGVARAHGGDLVYDDGAFVLRLPLAG